MIALRIGIYASSRQSDAAFDADYQALLDYATLQGYTLPSSGQQTKQNALVLALKAAGVWTKMDVFRVYATDGDDDFATLNWIDPATFQATQVNAPTFTPDEGFTGDGSTSYLDSSYTPSTDAVNMTQNSASVGVWIFAVQSSTTNCVYVGTGIGSAIRLRRSSQIMDYVINSVFNSPTSSGVDHSTGLWMINRDGANSIALYKDGSSISSDTTASLSLSADRTYELANRISTGANLYCDGAISVVHYGADLSAEASDFYNALNTYMSAI